MWTRRSCAVPAFLFALAIASSAQAMCVPFPCDGCQLLSQGQLNWVVMDRDAGEVRLIPNIRFNGISADFALVVPTPTLPVLEPADTAIWQQALDLTAPAVSRSSRGFGSSGCGETQLVASDARSGPTEEDGVIVHGSETVGGFIATFLSSADPDALVDWLQTNGYGIEADQAELFAPLVARGWFFTAMKPDPSDPPQMPVGGWDTNVDPVLFRYEADTFEVPLPLLSINQGSSMPIVLFVVDHHRMELSGFTTQYANRISSSEYAAIQKSHPELGGLLKAGLFLTRLDRTFGLGSDMSHSITMVRAPNDDEFRRVLVLFGWLGSNVPLELWLLGIALGGIRVARRRSERFSTR